MADENVRLKRRLLATQKRIVRSNRLKHNSCSNCSGSVGSVLTPNSNTGMESTPRSKSKHLLRSHGLSPRRVPAIRKKLSLHFAMVDGVKQAHSVEKARRSRLNSVSTVARKITRRYRLVSALRKELGASKHSINKQQMEILKREILPEQRKTKFAKVHAFLSSHENSTLMPGKKNYTSHKGQKIQRRVLNDYMKNLHRKFLAENPDDNMSRALFCSLRPKTLKLASYGARQTCLCQKHQNVSLKLRSLKRMGIVNTTNPDEFVRSTTDEEIDKTLQRLDAPNVKYETWKRVGVAYTKRGKQGVAQSTKIVKTEQSREEFIVSFKEHVRDFRSHVRRIITQSEAVRQLKCRLPDNEIICHMDLLTHGKLYVFAVRGGAVGVLRQGCCDIASDGTVLQTKM